MLTVPLAITGALLALFLTNQTANIYSMIGMITLIGLITKHGIMVCEFANQLQEQGIAKARTIIESAEARLRPILMTTGSMVIGLVPLAIASGPGAIGRQAIGWSVIGGLVLGTLLTLYVVPSLYLFIAPTLAAKKPVEASNGSPAA
jgi:multidrug efflux pump